jgi:hypothetical protein
VQFKITKRKYRAVVKYLDSMLNGSDSNDSDGPLKYTVDDALDDLVFVRAELFSEE